MSEWRECKLGDIAEVIDSLHQTPKYSDFGYPMVRVTDIKKGYLDLSNTLKVDKETFDKFSKNHIPNKGDIVFSRVGSYGNTAIVKTDENFCLGQNTAFIIPKENSLFLFYYLNSPIGLNEIESSVAGSTQPTVSLKSIKNFDVILPPLPEQKAIAAVLSSLDDKIDLLHRQNKTLEAMAETLFKQWFVVEAGEDWEEGCLGDIASFYNGKKRPDDITGGNIPIYGGNGILGYSDDFNYEGTTIIVGRVGAYCGSLYIEHKPVWISDNALVAKPINDKHSSFLFFLLKNLSLNEMAEGSSHPLLTQTLLKSIQITLPCSELIESFVIQVDIWLNKINFNNQQIQTLETLRDNLLPKLMSGEVRVKM